MTGQETIVFVCQHGSAKSLIAMEYFNRYAAQRGVPLRAISAGTEPDEAVPPEVVAGLAGDGFDVGGRTPLRATAELLARAVAIVSFGPDLDGLAPAGVPAHRWDDMPAVSDDYAAARDAIRARVSALLREAPPDRREAGS
jgi:protein-tyrosine-phosphatase